jgi:hypothetical protein
MEYEIYVTHCETFVTPKVFKFIGPCKDGRRHGRGTYLLFTIFEEKVVFYCFVSELIAAQKNTRLKGIGKINKPVN